MSDYRIDGDAKYAESHEWVRIEDGIALVGISDVAQDLLSDVVFVELPEVGRTVEAGEAVAVVESVKAAEDVYSPISGTVIEVNSSLEATPELVNDRPYEAWFFKIQPGRDLTAKLEALMDAKAYAQFAAESAG